jgi:hypothetical protein
MWSNINAFFEKLTGTQRLLAFLGVLTASTLVLTLWTQGLTATLLVSAVLTTFLWLTRFIWVPPGYGQTRVRLASLAIVMTTALTVAGWRSWLETLVLNLLQQVIPDDAPTILQNLPTSDGLLPGLVLAFVLAAVYIVNSLNQSPTAMGIHPIPIDQDIPETTFRQQLKNVCDSLSEDLRGIDIKTNWSASYFTPLEAEVEVSTPSGTRRRTADLLGAIRRSNARLFLVLGEPGSGKSVALRKLCQDLAKEVDKTGKIPIYINLKEWRPERKWNASHPPTVDELYAFIFTNIKSRDIVTSRFFSKYFDRLYEAGRLFFVLDSFDEIPAVLDEKENSELIRNLSHMIFKFLKGARAEESQGILASRNFRRPTSEFQTEMTLEILPFTEEKVVQTLERHGETTRRLATVLFRDRSELVPVARNPFAAALIADYASVPGRGLPSSQSEMYSAYISTTLDAVEERIERKKLNKEVVLEVAIKIADVMFQDIGLEASVAELRTKLANHPVDDVVEILKFARLGRGVAGDESRFSFVHRRFAEYFAVQELLERNKDVKFEEIPEDSQWRDAYVLYCEVANPEKSEEIARFCWEVIKGKHNPLDLRVIHCMRFLRDAFKG